MRLKELEFRNEDDISGKLLNITLKYIKQAPRICKSYHGIFMLHAFE